MEIRVFMVGYEMECEKSVFIQTRHFDDLALWLEWVMSLSHEITSRPDCTFCPVVLQLSWPFNSLHASHVWRLASHESVARLLLKAYNLSFFTFSHTQPLHYSHLNTGFLHAEVQANLAWNKANTWLNHFNLIDLRFQAKESWSIR